MKRKLLHSAAILFAIIALLSCGKDEVKNTILQEIPQVCTNCISYEGKNYNLTQGHIKKHGLVDGYYEHLISLYDADVTYVNEVVGGIGTNVTIFLYLNSDGEIVNGTYSAPEMELEQVYIDYNFNESSGVSYLYKSYTGSFNYSKTGSEYILKYTGTYNGKPIAINYTGELTFYDKTK